MHFENVDEAIAKGDSTLLHSRDGEACVRGCYRCLLSYFNQPDHEMIDRTSDEAKQMLIDLARGQLVLAVAPDVASEDGDWAAAFKAVGLPPPDTSTISISGHEMSFAWRSHFVAASVAPIDNAVRGDAEAKGWTLFDLSEVESGVPDALMSMFREMA